MINEGEEGGMREMGGRDGSEGREERGMR